MTRRTKSEWKPPHVKCVTGTLFALRFAGVTMAFTFENGICLLFLCYLWEQKPVSPRCWKSWGLEMPLKCHLLLHVRNQTCRNAHLALPFHQDDVRDDGRLGQSPWRFHLGSTEGTGGFLHDVVVLANSSKQGKSVALTAWHRHWDVIPGKLCRGGDGGVDLNRYIQMSTQGMKSLLVTVRLNLAVIFPHFTE